MLFHFLSDYEKSGSKNYGQRCYRSDYAVQVLKGIWNQRPDNNCYFMFCRSFPFFSPRKNFVSVVNSRRLSAFIGSIQGADINKFLLVIRTQISRLLLHARQFSAKNSPTSSFDEMSRTRLFGEESSTRPQLGGDCRLCKIVVIALPRSCYASQWVHLVYSAVDEGSGLKG